MEEELDPQQFGVTLELFKEWGAPRFGNANPQKINSKVWEWLVRSKLSAYASRQKLNDPSIFMGGPTWCFDRFGQSVTQLPDGRTVYIAGEHEDSYDVDFYIYNDVVVTHPDGTIDFYCYPKSDFPPTDFHTATLIDDTIVIIGSLGYSDERNPNDTQVYRLSLDTFEIHKVATSGTSPGWIHRHSATLSEDGRSIILTKGKLDIGREHSLRENIDDWKLHLDEWRWERLTSRNWIRFDIRRRDKKYNHLWEIRQALWSLEVNWPEQYQAHMDRLQESLGYRPDVNLVKDLYNFGQEHQDLQRDEEVYNMFWFYIGDVRIRFMEESHVVQVAIEGSLSTEQVNIIKKQLLEKTSALENSPCELEEY
jgi:hypothetical protein